jgi:hypothetical protein
MTMHKTLTWLVPLVALLALITASAGLFLPGGDGPFTFTTLRGHEVEMFGRGLYQYDTLLVGAALRGTDAVTLLVSLPLLVLFYWKSRRGSPNAPLALLGVLFYFLYKGASLTFSAAFNPLFLVYIALFSSSLFAVIIAMTTFDIKSPGGARSARFSASRCGDFPVRCRVWHLADLVERYHRSFA